MFPALDSWLGIKSEPVEDTPVVGNVSRSWQWRERGTDPPNYPPNKKVFENIAEDILVQKPLQIRSCDLPGYPRSTFLMVFSPDGTKVASTHGNHNVYVSELASGKHVRILKGHPRTPWCIAFHPSHPQLIGSGCLGGQVRVWDIASGGSEVWNVRNETVIASIAFHPREQLLVIATYNELYFWDWSHPAPFTKVSTNNVNEKVRFVAFDSLGYKLITGISLWACPANANSHPLSTSSSSGGTPSGSGGPPGSGAPGGAGGAPGGSGGPGADGGGAPGDPPPGPPRETHAAAQDMIVNSYQTLVQRYDSLVRNYQRLFMVRHRLTNTPPPTNTIDRGTDPMETYPSESGRRRRGARRSPRTNNETTNPTPSTSRRHDGGDSGDGESSSSRFLNLDVLSFDSDASRTQESPTRERSPLGSASSAFQPLSESMRSSRTLDLRERTRLLPNPFSSRSGYQRSPGDGPSLVAPAPPARTSSLTYRSSRTSIFTSSRSDTALGRNVVLMRRRNSSGGSASTAPATTNSGTQMSPDADVDAQTINESLDLIRDILRDSGTRLLNLITNMSMNLMSGRAADDEFGLGTRPRRPLGNAPGELFVSSSDSDSDHADILRTPNSAFREESSSATASERARSDRLADRLSFDLEEVASASGRFRVRTQNGSPPEEGRVADGAAPANTETLPRPQPQFDPNVPSTSRDNFWSRGPEMSSADAYRRVRRGVNALQKHTLKLSQVWMCGERLSMRQLRIMWENLRRRVLALSRQAVHDDPPGYYTRGLLERCMILTEMSALASRRPSAAERRAARSDDARRSSADPVENGTSAETNTEPEPSTSSDFGPVPRASRSPSTSRATPFFRRRFQSSHRQTGEGARQSRAVPRRHARRDLARALEMGTTKHEIRMRAMQVLSAMFNMMMMCLGERGLSQVIMHMLKALKKALALSCFMMMSTRNETRARADPAPPPRLDSDVVRIQNAEHAGPVNVDGPDEPTSPAAAEGRDEDGARDTRQPEPGTAAASTQSSDARSADAASLEFGAQKWSHRLAVQIAAANRNTSSIARTRRDLYLESKRLKALHRTNPAAHPLVRRRPPPLSTHRIPALRRLPARGAAPPPAPAPEEPVAGPSTSHDSDRNSRDMSDFNNRLNLLRLAQIQATRLRNAARNRIRRLQTIRLYTPSSVFALQSNENPSENRDSQSDGDSRRRFVSLASATAREAESLGEPAQFHAVLNNVGVPLLQVNEPSGEQQPSAPPPAQRLPRIHEYLQPIILAQNAMVVEDEGEGGGVGIVRRVGAGMGWDAGVLSDNLPTPSNRVQAWDFTTGQTPDIADSTKNVVVQRCRIHNDASIDISKDGRLLVALLPGTRLRSNSWLGVYSLEWGRLGQCLHTAMLEQSAVSVALSPTARYLAVGLGSRRFTSVPHARTNVIALLYKLDPLENSSRTGLSPIKELMQHWEHGFTSLNCLRWAPQPGQGLVYANNTGQLIIMS